jgi:hypothetical protein
MWGDLSDERTGLQLLLVLASAVIYGYESRWTRGHILLSQIRDFPISSTMACPLFVTDTCFNFLASRCLAMDYSGFQASCHNIITHFTPLMK